LFKKKEGRGKKEKEKEKRKDQRSTFHISEKKTFNWPYIVV